MPSTSVILVSRDDTLSHKVRTELNTIDQLRLEAIPTYDETLVRLRRAEAALVLAHLTANDHLPRITDLLQALSAGRPTPVVVIGESGLAEHGLALLRQGAADYLERPLNLRRLGYLLNTLTARVRFLAAQQREPVEQIGPQADFLFSPQGEMGRVMDQVHRIAPVGTSILIQGETGTGKTRLARLIHDLSPRRDQPFLVVNCAALSASLIESEMFGHVKGAFTGADRDRTGKFAEAGGGTLLLDEVNSLPVELQAKLLRVVEDRVFEPVGSNRPQQFQARLITASNRPLDAEVEAGRFRSDLFFRLNVVAFQLPALRDQVQILPALADRFVQEFAAKAGRDIPGLTPEAVRTLRGYGWPGNVRELRNAIERAVALRLEGLIELDDLPDVMRDVAAPRASTADISSLRTLAESRLEVEAHRIAEALRRNKNNRLRTALELGISRMTLYKKLHRYGIIGAAG